MPSAMARPELREHVPLATMTSWRVGGNARYFAEPSDVEAIRALMLWAKREDWPVFVMGRGSNLLISDAGFPGLVIRLAEKFAALTVAGGRLRAQAGSSTMAAVKAAAQAGFGGISFLSTIPGTIGGTVFMNAGAHQACMADVLESATLLLADGSVVTEDAAALGYRYRHSNLRERGATVLEAVIRVTPADAEAVQQEVQGMSRWRRERQPQALSAGSVFTNPPMASAGKLIEDAGLKGETVGRAQISPVHANFIVNQGGATAADINGLIMRVQERIYALHGFWLHPEVVGVGLVVGHQENGDVSAQARE